MEIVYYILYMHSFYNIIFLFRGNKKKIIAHFRVVEKVSRLAGYDSNHLTCQTTGVSMYRQSEKYFRNLYTNTVLDGLVMLSVCLSVILSVRYRNHFPVAQFQIQAHIWNPHDPAKVFKTMVRPKLEAPQIFLFFFIAAEGDVS